MKIQDLKLVLLGMALLAIPYINHAQDTFKVNQNQSDVLIKGTSNIHDWEIDVESINSELQLSDTSQDLLLIKSIVLSIPIKSMKSGKGGMDKNTYKALNADKYELIKFRSTSIKKISNKYVAIGQLSIAGTSKEIKVNLNINKTDRGIQLKTSSSINMLDYNVEPPTALFGTIKTGKDVTVITNLIYNK